MITLSFVATSQAGRYILMILLRPDAFSMHVEMWGGVFGKGYVLPDPPKSDSDEEGRGWERATPSPKPSPLLGRRPSSVGRAEYCQLVSPPDVRFEFARLRQRRRSRLHAS